MRSPLRPLLLACLACSPWLAAPAARAGMNAGATARIYWQAGTAAGLANRNSTAATPQLVVTLRGVRNFRGADLRLDVRGIYGTLPPAWQLQNGGCAAGHATLQRGGFGGAYPDIFAASPPVPGIAEALDGMYFQDPKLAPCFLPDWTAGVVAMSAAGAVGEPRDPGTEFALFALRVVQDTGSCVGSLADPNGPLPVGVTSHFPPCSYGYPTLLVLDSLDQVDDVPFEDGYDLLTWEFTHGPWEDAGTAVSPTPGTAPAVAADGSGGALFAWVQGDTAIRAQHLDADGVARAWGPFGLLVAPGGLRVSGAQVFPDGAGGALVAWLETDAGAGDTLLRTQHYTATGKATFRPGGAAACTRGRAKSGLVGALDGTGGAYLAWSEGSPADADVYAQRITPADTAAWGPGGLAVCAAPGAQLHPAVAAVAGGAVFAWDDGRVAELHPAWDSGLDIDARGVSAAGAVLWDLAACRFAGDQSHPALCPDGSGGAFLSWQGPSTTAGHGLDIYGRRVGALAPEDSLPWTLLGGGPGDDTGPVACADGSGGAYFAWTHAAPEGCDIFGQHADAGLALSWAADPAAPGLPVCAAPGAQVTPRILAGAQAPHDLFVAWVDARISGAAWPAPPDSTALYAQRLSAAAADGAPAWGANGMRVVIAPAGPSPTLAAAGDGAGGAVLAWADAAAASLVYAQRVSGEGTWGSAVGVQPRGPRPVTLRLRATPNPSPGRTTLGFDLPAAGLASLEVTDVAGRVVRHVVGPLALQPGTHTFAWDGRDGSGRRVSAGVYFAVLHTPLGARSTKLVTLH